MVTKMEHIQGASMNLKCKLIFESFPSFCKSLERAQMFDFILGSDQKIQQKF